MTPQELTTWRKKRYLNQIQLGKLLNVSRQTVINWEHGHYPVPDDLQTRLDAVAPLVEREQAVQEDTINPAAFPSLFRFSRELGRSLPSRLHPNSLARRGLLGWPGCTWCNAVVLGGHPPAKPAILASDHYAAAVIDLDEGRTHPGVEAVARFYRSGLSPAGFTIMPHKDNGWPGIMLDASVEPVEGFNCDPTYPRPIPAGAWAAIRKPLPDGYYWSVTGALVVPGD